MNNGKKFDFDIVIVGGGAAGLAAAVSAGYFAKSFRAGCGASSGAGGVSGMTVSIAVLEKKETAGKKLSATGNGRCNLSNIRCEDRAEVEEFFHAIGLITKTDDTGRMYPYGEEAGEVVRLLVETARSLHVKIVTGCSVEAVTPLDGGWEIGCRFDGAAAADGENGKGGGATPASGTIRARKVLLAMGGKSYSAFGTTGDGYRLARQLGHGVTRLAPSLVPVEVHEDIRGLAGVRVPAQVTLLRDGEAVDSEAGEVQFNKDCLSGICVMNLSRLLVLEPGKSFEEAFGAYEMEHDLMPEWSEEELTGRLRQRARAIKACREAAMDGAQGKEESGNSGISEISGRDAEELLRTLVKRKLAAWLSAQITWALETVEGAAEDREIYSLKRMAHLLKHLRFHVKGTKGWNDAQVTRGGVVLSKIDEETMASEIAEGIYFAGELLDYDGPCGGYNLHFAWKSGVRAGKAMAKAALEERAGGRSGESGRNEDGQDDCSRSEDGCNEDGGKESGDEV